MLPTSGAYQSSKFSDFDRWLLQITWNETIEALAGAPPDHDRVDPIGLVEAIHDPDEGAFPSGLCHR
jgi:hypothetical protein